MGMAGALIKSDEGCLRSTTLLNIPSAGRAVLQDPGLVRQALPAHSVLQNINFAVAFQDELQVAEGKELSLG